MTTFDEMISRIRNAKTTAAVKRAVHVAQNENISRLIVGRNTSNDRRSVERAYNDNQSAIEQAVAARRNA